MAGRINPQRRSLDQFPAEILIMIMKELPDFATLHCLIVASDAALSIFEQRTRNKEILDSMRANYGQQVTDLDMKLALGIPWNMTDRLSDLADIPLPCNRPANRVERASFPWLAWLYLKTNKRGITKWHGCRTGHLQMFIVTVGRFLRWGEVYDLDALYARVHGWVATLLKANEIVSWLGLEFPRVEDWKGCPSGNSEARSAIGGEYGFFDGYSHNVGGWVLPHCYLESALVKSGYYCYSWHSIDFRPLLNRYANHIAENKKTDNSATLTATPSLQTYPTAKPCRCSRLYLHC